MRPRPLNLDSLDLERTDVLIVGAGLAGASLAWHLAGSRRVLLVEQAEQPCAEASAQNAGMVRRLVTQARERALACRSHELLVDLPDDGHDWAGIPPFRRTGAVIALAERDDPALAAAAADLRARIIAVEELAARRRRHRRAGAGRPTAAPGLLAARRRDLRRVVARPGLPPRRPCDAAPSSAAASASSALTSTAVGVTGVRTDHGAIAADTVVLAAGAWSRALARTAGLDRPFRPLARHLFGSAPHPLSRRDHPWCWVDDGGVYVRPEAGGFLCSPCDEAEREPAPRPRLGASPGRVVAARSRRTNSSATSRRSRILRLTAGWIGLRTFAPDRHAVVGLDPELDGPRPGWPVSAGSA